VSDSHRPVRQFAATVALIAGIDLLSKQVASVLLANGGAGWPGPIDLVLTYNTGSIFGVSLGSYTWQWNTLATLTALLLTVIVLRPLCSVDRRAPIALGLVGGAALGNLTSLLAPPAGVTDFLLVRVGESGGLIMNFADLAAYAGVALIVRSAMLLRVEIVAQRTVRVRPSRVRDLEVPIPVLADGPAARPLRHGAHDLPAKAHTPYGDAREAPREEGRPER
jgi:lipoprotein signal peptidase